MCFFFKLLLWLFYWLIVLMMIFCCGRFALSMTLFFIMGQVLGACVTVIDGDHRLLQF